MCYRLNRSANAPALSTYGLLAALIFFKGTSSIVLIAVPSVPPENPPFILNAVIKRTTCVAGLEAALSMPMPREAETLEGMMMVWERVAV
jgi:hypothetical protein